MNINLKLLLGTRNWLKGRLDAKEPITHSVAETFPADGMILGFVADEVQIAAMLLCSVYRNFTDPDIVFENFILTSLWNQPLQKVTSDAISVVVTDELPDSVTPDVITKFEITVRQSLAEMLDKVEQILLTLSKFELNA
jgi:hypothetical protein